MRQCDNLDGLVDGVINNYMACRAIFDVTSGARDRRPWAAKRCPNNVDPNPADTTTAACLTDGQISTLEMIYSPYRFPAPLAHGVRQFGMWLPTIEPSGSGLLVGTRFQGQEGAAADAVKHAHLGVLGVTGWIQRDLSANPLDFTEAAYAQRRKQLSEWADATDPDLSAFYARGGKLISAISAQDTLASPGAQLDYYQSVLDKMGRAKVDAFARLYVLPQGNHGMAATHRDGRRHRQGDSGGAAADDLESLRAARRLGRAQHAAGQGDHDDRRRSDDAAVFLSCVSEIHGRSAAAGELLFLRRAAVSRLRSLDALTP